MAGIISIMGQLPKRVAKAASKDVEALGEIKKRHADRVTGLKKAALRKASGGKRG